MTGTQRDIFPWEDIENELFRIEWEDPWAEELRKIADRDRELLDELEKVFMQKTAFGRYTAGKKKGLKS